MSPLDTWIDALIDDARREAAARHTAGTREDGGASPAAALRCASAPPQRPAVPPRATYRLQFNRSFTFRDATALVPYLKQLGISHVYASPYLKARPGSLHGYDVCDHNELNPEIGGADDYRLFVETLHSYGMGQILDVVPNHMSITSDQNAWWNDVLENGPSSRYARCFDIDWYPVQSELAGKLLLPILGGQYGDVLESGKLKLAYEEGRFVLRYFDNVLPIAPRTAVAVLTHKIEDLRETLGEEAPELQELLSIVTALEHLPHQTETAPEKIEERQREKEVVKRRLDRLCEESPAVREFIARNVREFNGRTDDPHSYDLLDALLHEQPYRLSHWRAAADEINYRRFFDVNDLAAVCMEDREVFESAHRLVLQLLATGDVCGLRIDHIDGLYDPAEYLGRLQESYLRELARHAYEKRIAAVGQATDGSGLTQRDVPPWHDLEPALLDRLRRELIDGAASAAVAATAALSVRTDSLSQVAQAPGEGHPDRLASLERAQAVTTRGALRCGRRPALFVLVEKILGPDEPLPEDWPCAGTTGYDFLASLNGLFVDPAGLRQVVKLYSRFIGERLDFAEVAYRMKFLILQVSMSSELHMLAHRLNRLSEAHRRSRDFTFNTLRHALREILACFPVYRTYIGPAGVSERDRRFVHMAVAQAKRRNPAIGAAIFDFIRDTLLLEYPPDPDEAVRKEREVFVGRFQQVTSPVMAKGVEDTAFYVYCPLISLNEVGGEPRTGTTSPAEFHRANEQRLRRWPASMLATTTHDTKRSEDVRARISVLSEIPHQWRAAVNRWARLNRRHRREVDGLPAPSRNDEYVLYQTLVGSWPLEPMDAAAHAEFVRRIQQYMEKASHEAKQRTSWINPNPAYDQAVRDFVAAVLANTKGNRFLADFRAFHEGVLNWGLYNALSQTLLKLASPGVPDIYQGQELWDFSLVDPDNRREVDYNLRRWLLGELEAAAGIDSRESSVERGAASDSHRSTLNSQPYCDLVRRFAHNPRDRRTKLLVTWQALRCRREHPKLFARGKYVALEAHGARADHVCALARVAEASDGPTRARRGRQNATVVVAVAPRLIAQLTPPAEPGRPTPPPIGRDIWHDTTLDVSSLPPGRFRDVFTRRELTVGESRVSLAEILADFPVALLLGAW